MKCPATWWLIVDAAQDHNLALQIFAKEFETTLDLIFRLFTLRECVYNSDGYSVRDSASGRPPCDLYIFWDMDLDQFYALSRIEDTSTQDILKPLDQ